VNSLPSPLAVSPVRPQPTRHRVFGLERLALAHHELVESVEALRDEDLHAASALPGWTRGHVVAHLARQADGLRNLLSWAQTGVRRPMYGPVPGRDAEIARDRGRPASLLLADVAVAGRELLQHAAELTVRQWACPVALPDGRVVAARRVLALRLREVLVHHVDLALGYTPESWPFEAAQHLLAELAAELEMRGDYPALQVDALDTGASYRIGGPGPVARVRGLSRELAAWLMGRGASEDLSCVPGPLPALPTWR
jgi:maleylpyruvate isomerase